MINWLLEQAVIISVIGISLTMAASWLTSRIGSRAYYWLWIAVPASLCLSFILPAFYYFNVSPPQVLQLTVASNFKQSVSQIANPSTSLSLVSVWLGVATILLLMLVARHVAFIKVIRQNSHQLDLKGQRLSKDVPANLRLFESSSITGPALTGLLRPTILLPVGFSTRLPPHQVQMVIEHELVHAQRRDLMWNLLANTIVICFWFNPIIWYAYRGYREAQELACDHAVVHNRPQSERIEYAKAMLHCLQLNVRMQPNLVNYGVKQQMKKRLVQLQNPNAGSTLIRTIMAIVVSSAVLMIQSVNASDVVRSETLRPDIRIEPKYPLDAAIKGIEGSVLLKFDVETNGTVSNVRIVEAHPADTFEQNAVDAVKKWRWLPTTKLIEDVHVQLDFEADDDWTASALMGSNTEQIVVTR